MDSRAQLVVWKKECVFVCEIVTTLEGGAMPWATREAGSGRGLARGSTLPGLEKHALTSQESTDKYGQDSNRRKKGVSMIIQKADRV